MVEVFADGRHSTGNRKMPSDGMPDRTEDRLSNTKADRGISRQQAPAILNLNTYGNIVLSGLVQSCGELSAWRINRPSDIDSEILDYLLRPYSVTHGDFAVDQKWELVAGIASVDRL